MSMPRNYFRSLAFVGSGAAGIAAPETGYKERIPAGDIWWPRWRASILKTAFFLLKGNNVGLKKMNTCSSRSLQSNMVLPPILTSSM